MDDRSGAADSWHGPLSVDERAALAAWAEHEPPDGFADAVLAAWGDDGERPVEPEPTAAPAEIVRWPRRASSRRGVVGIAAAFAAAAVVMLMVRVLPDGAGGVASAESCAPDRPLVASVGVGSAAASPGPTAVEPGAGDSVLEADAMAVLTRHCSPCHDSADPEAKPGALEVFDLRQRRWSGAMSDAQLREANLRITELGAARDDERRSVATFVDAELARRAHAG